MSSARREPIRILPLGDSITQGGKADREEYTYRLPLQRMLNEAGYRYQFVGSMRSGLQPDAKWPATVAGRPFDPAHEGHYGWITRRCAEELPGWMKTYAGVPDIVIMHLGSNDHKAADPATKPSPDDPAKSITDENLVRELYARAVTDHMEKIIALLREKNPQVAFLIGHCHFKEGWAAKMRPVVEDMAQRLSTAQSPIITIHHYLDFNAEPDHPDTDTFDWSHPNPKGQEKMAAILFKAMKPFLDELSH